MAAPATQAKDIERRVGIDRRYLAIAAVAAAGLFLSLLGYRTVVGYDRRAEARALSAAAQSQLRTIRQGIDKYQSVLASLRRSLEAYGDRTDKAVFHALGAGVLPLWPAFRAVAWVPRVDARHRARLEAGDCDTSPAFHVAEFDRNSRLAKAPARSEYFPICSVSAAAGVDLPLGLDLASVPLVRRALDLARDNGTETVGPAIGETGEPKSGAELFIFDPVYRTGSPQATPKQRQENLRGFVLGVFAFPDLLDQAAYATRPPRRLDVYLYEGDGSTGYRLLDFHSSRPSQTPMAPNAVPDPLLGPHWYQDIRVANRTYSIMLASRDAAVTASAADWNALAALVGGLLFTCLISLALVFATWRRLGLRRATLELHVTRRALEAEVWRHEAAARDVKRRDALIEAMANCTAELVEGTDVPRSFAKALELVGPAAQLDVAWLSPVRHPEDDRAPSATFAYWVAPNIKPPWDAVAFRHLDLRKAGPARWSSDLADGKLVMDTILDLPETRDSFFRQAGLRSVTLAPVFDDAGWWGVVGFASFDSERKWAAAELSALRTIAELFSNMQSRSHAQAELVMAGRIIENSPTILARMKPKIPPDLIYISQNVRRYGFQAEDLIANPAEWLRLFHPEDQPAMAGDVQDIVTGKATTFERELRFRQRDGSLVWFEGRLTGIRDGAGRLVSLEGMLYDITERKQNEQQITYLARHDPLTGLDNRVAFMERLDEMFMVARRGGKAFALHYFDIDRFKDVNDAFGHATGDLLLKAVAGRLTGLRRESDAIARLSIARFGGDEFGILQTEMTEPSDAGSLAARIIRMIENPFVVDGREFHITASIGIAVYDAHIGKAEDMMTQADLALYRAKDLGRNQYRFHSEDLDPIVRERVAIAEELHGAAARGELELFYQPEVEAPSRIVGMEALVRWNNPKRGLVPPSVFIPIAERTGAIVMLGNWVLEEACRQMNQWKAQGITLPRISVNVSGAQLKLSPYFDREVAEILRKWDLDPRGFEIEITESVLVETTQAHNDILSRLSGLGIGIAIDDFGTGYSSLDYLRLYPVTRLKIAQQFVSNLTAQAGDAAIVRATIGLAHALGIAIVAEGVETPAQLAFLLEAGCREIQGHYFSPAVPAAEAAELLRQGRIVRAEPPP